MVTMRELNDGRAALVAIAAAFLLFLMSPAGIGASTKPHIFQSPALSRDLIVFGYAGDLWTVSRQMAAQLASTLEIRTTVHGDSVDLGESPSSPSRKNYLTGREPVMRISTSRLALCCQSGPVATLDTPISARSRWIGSRSLRMSPLLMARHTSDRIASQI